MAFLESARVINLKIKTIAFPQKNKDGILVAKIEGKIPGELLSMTI